MAAPPEDHQQPLRQRLLTDTGAGHGRRDRAGGPFTPDRGLARDLRLAAVWPVDGQHHPAGMVLDRAESVPQPDLAARRSQRLAQPLHQLMLRVTAVGAPVCQGGILDHHRFSRGAELAPVVLD